MTESAQDSILRDKSIRVFKFLKDLALLKSKIKRDVSEYERVAWFSEIPSTKGCFSIASSKPDESRDGVWLDVRKSADPPKPPVPPSCARWIDDSVAGVPLDEPRLKDKAPGKSNPVSSQTDAFQSRFTSSPVSFDLLSDHPEVVRDWQQYLQMEWRPWTEKFKIWKAADDLYYQLFWIHQQQKKLGERYELVLGIGLLTWQTPNNQSVKRHIIVGDAYLEFDADRAKFTVQGAPDGIKLRFETEMVEPHYLPSLKQQKDLEVLLSSVQEAPWNADDINKILRSWVNSVSPDGEYKAEIFPPGKITAKPVVTFAPALILRQRTEQGQVQCFTKVAGQLGEGGMIPSGVGLLCEIAENSPGSEMLESNLKVPENDAEIQYLPLEANDEQIQILHQARIRKGILVQGPPGTGKSHTIANLICHLLAQGKRVLITSQTPRALKVLKEKIPVELRALCVVLLGNDQDSRRELEESVQSINQRYSVWDTAKSQREIKLLETQLQDIKKTIAGTEFLLRESREVESSEQTVCKGAYKGTVQQIAIQIKAQENQYSWLSEDIQSDEDCPLSNSELAELLGLYRELTDALCQEIDQKAISIGEIPDIDNGIKLIEEEKQSRQKWAEYSDKFSTGRFQALARTAEDQRKGLHDSISALAVAVGSLNKRFPWVQQAITDILSDNDTSWRELEYFTANHLKDLDKKAVVAQTVHLECPPALNRKKLLSDSKALINHLANGGNMGWKFFAPEVVKQTRYIIESVKINGSACSDLDTLKLLALYLETADEVEQVWSAWEGKDKKEEASLLIQVGCLRERLESLDSVLGLQAGIDAARAAVKAIEGLAEPPWQKPEEIDAILFDLKAVEYLKAYERARDHIDEYIRKIQAVESRPDSHSINKDISRALRERDPKMYAGCLEKLKDIEKNRQLFSRRNVLYEKLSSAVPDLSQQLRADFASECWDRRASTFESAWVWKQADQWLDAFHAEHDRSYLETLLQKLSRDQRSTISQLAAAMAWHNCLENLTEFQRANLIAWALAIKKFGKGTGKYAPVYLKQAQESMEKCKGAIPAWIMPLYRVFETINPEPEMFDVVIIDEASQTGPEGVILQYLGKQTIVVGDSEQISPEAVGTDLSAVNSLIARHLKDIPFSDRYEPNTSFFDHAAIRFSGRIVLREHFRCMPEIIRFSNDLCYKATPLKPLRQYPPRRLDPIVTRYVEDGLRQGSGAAAINRPEAEALVNSVVKVCALPEYKDKTVGIISLQGEEQAKYIEGRLLESLPAGELQKRRLVCGDAYAFQGDERDILFLSMVAAPNERIGALTGEAAKRRFNVAASRAKDQVWLFHSVNLNELNPDCMRYKLLKYYLEPGTPKFEMDLTQCKSQFEKDVCQAIAGRMYRVIPQYNVADYRIDMVVEGDKNRLAIECEGDQWQGIEEYDRDMARQRMLERCGWRFWRIRGSEYYRRPEESLNSLWDTLAGMGIQPVEPAQPGPVAEISGESEEIEPADNSDNL